MKVVAGINCFPQGVWMLLTHYSISQHLHH